MTTNKPAKQEPSEVMTAKSLFSKDTVKAKFQELLGKRATSFVTSVLQIVSQNEMLSKADPVTVFHAATVAATLDLPLNNNLGFAYIVPYNNSKTRKQEAQFQMGYKGYKQLAIRSGQYQTLATKIVYEGQITQDNSFQGYKFDWAGKTSDKVVGYANYFRLLSGYESIFYMDIESVRKHGKRYSQTFKKGFGLWEDDFDKMALKTVCKLHLNSGDAPLSVEMQRAIITDQAIINNEDATDITYVDNEAETVDKELERAGLLIEDTKSHEELESLWNSFGSDIKVQLAGQMESKYNELEK